MAAYVGGMRLPAEYLGEVVAELRRRQESDFTAEARRLEREIERWRRLYVLGEIDEARLRREITPAKRRLAEVDRPHEVLNVERAVGYLLDMGSLWAESRREVQREFVKEVFARVVVEDQQLAAITPRPVYAPFFALDRQERFAGDFGRIKGGVEWLPGRGLKPQSTAEERPDVTAGLTVSSACSSPGCHAKTTSPLTPAPRKAHNRGGRGRRLTYSRITRQVVVRPTPSITWIDSETARPNRSRSSASNSAIMSFASAVAFWSSHLARPPS